MSRPIVEAAESCAGTQTTKSWQKVHNGEVTLTPEHMEAFDFNPPGWTKSAVHAREFCCPTCRSTSQSAQGVWINRRSPVFTEDHRRKWQEFYHCECGQAWWAWSSDRPASELAKQDREPPPRPLINPFEDF